MFGTLLLSACLSVDGGDESRPGAGAMNRPAYVEYGFSSIVELDGHEDSGPSGRLGVSLSGAFNAPDETGVDKPWRAMQAVALDMSPPRSVFYVLLDDESGCPRGAGNEGSIFAEGSDGSLTHETRSRYTEYFLGNPSYLVKQLERSGLRETLFVTIGMLVRNDVSDEALQGLLGARIDRSGSRPTLGFEDPVYVANPGDWTVEFAYDGESFGGVPSAVTWTHRLTGQHLEKGAITLREAEGRSEAGVAFTCVSTQSFAEPRVPTRLLSDQDIPYRGAVPAEYPMLDGYNDARADQNVSDFMKRHPDARLMGMINDGLQFVFTGQPAKVREYSWHTTFASPADDVRLQVQTLRRGVEPVGSAYWGSQALDGELPVLGSFHPTPIAKQEPLVSTEEAIAIAKHAGLESINRLGWGEPPYLSFENPLWFVGFHHPDYGNTPTATRTYFFVNAETGWILYSAVNVAPQG